MRSSRRWVLAGDGGCTGGRRPVLGELMASFTSTYADSVGVPRRERPQRVVESLGGGTADARAPVVKYSCALQPPLIRRPERGVG